MTQSVKVSRYLALGPEKGVGIAGQPEPHYYFHRPLVVLLTACFRAGFAMTGLEEPAFETRGQADPLSWESFRDIPRSWWPGCSCPRSRRDRIDKPDRALQG